MNGSQEMPDWRWQLSCLGVENYIFQKRKIIRTPCRVLNIKKQKKNLGASGGQHGYHTHKPRSCLPPRRLVVCSRGCRWAKYKEASGPSQLSQTRSPVQRIHYMYIVIYVWSLLLKAACHGSQPHILRKRYSKGHKLLTFCSVPGLALFPFHEHVLFQLCKHDSKMEQ